MYRVKVKTTRFPPKTLTWATFHFMSRFGLPSYIFTSW